ncbi:agouti-related protein isoform X1 [Xenopus tropicalis]|uniref:Agouti-related protein isoform X1 n=1 Tax=Xenopus tropicalis TaxID=8364 RepID=A0A8J1JFG4_XENTR|nr:agouti-related protein isoform X1 [Xenopus tropicalis]
MCLMSLVTLRAYLLIIIPQVLAIQSCEDTMFNTVLLCVAMIQTIQASLTSETSNGRLQVLSSGMNNERYNYPNLLHKVKETAMEGPGNLARNEYLKLDSEADEEDLMEDYSLLDPRALSLEVSSREERSPRRCVQLLESCVGHLPCCSPCATCYCRFFNAFCYCRKTSTNCHHGKN